jgi:hypothetical protein
MRAAPYRDIILSWLSQTAAGALTWAQTLSSGNLSGGSDPTISAGDRILFDGVREQPAATFALNESIPATPVLDVAGANYIGATATASTSLRFQTGEAEADAAGLGPSSGVVQMFTGATNDGAGTAGPSGQVLISTGAVNSAAGSGASGQILMGTGNTSGGSRRTGNFRVITGTATSSGRSGDLDFDTGPNNGSGDSGVITFNTGISSGGDSGGFSVQTGSAAAGFAGDISFATGAGLRGGPIGLSAGQSDGLNDGPEVSLQAGRSTLQVGGDVRLFPGEGATGWGRIQLGLQDTLYGVQQQAARVQTTYTEWQGDGFQGIASRSVWQKKITGQVAAVPTTIADDPDFEFQDNHAGTAAPSTTSGLSLIQATGSAGDYSVIRTDQLAGVSSWGKASLSRGTRYTVGGTVEMSAIAGRYEVGARPTTNAFDNTTDDNKTILVYDPNVSPNWQAVTSSGGSDFVDDTGIPGLGGGALNYRIVINTNNQVEYWLTNPARGGRLELVVVRSVGLGLAGCIMYAGCICNVPASVPQFGWGNPIQAVNL